MQNSTKWFYSQGETASLQRIIRKYKRWVNTCALWKEKTRFFFFKEHLCTRNRCNIPRHLFKLNWNCVEVQDFKTYPLYKNLIDKLNLEVLEVRKHHDAYTIYSINSTCEETSVTQHANTFKTIDWCHIHTTQIYFYKHWAQVWRVKL